MPHLRARANPDKPFLAGSRSHAHVQATKRRIAHLAAGGRTAGEIAATEPGIDAAQVEALLGDEGFGKLVRAYKVFSAKGDAEQRDKLVRLALRLIEEAIGLGHVRVGFLVVRERLHGRAAAETVVDKLLRQRAKAAEPAPALAEPPPAEPEAQAVPARPARPRLPAHPADRMARRACGELQRALLGEFRLREEARARVARRRPPAVARPATRRPPPPDPGDERGLPPPPPARRAGYPPKLSQAP